MPKDGIALLAGNVGATPANSEGDHKVRIRHRTNSESNPYTSNDVDIASVNGQGGEGDHYLNHTGPIGPLPDHQDGATSFRRSKAHTAA